MDYEDIDDFLKSSILPLPKLHLSRMGTAKVTSGKKWSTCRMSFLISSLQTLWLSHAYYGPELFIKETDKWYVVATIYTMHRSILPSIQGVQHSPLSLEF